MGDDIEINVTETTNIIEITPQPNDQIVDIAVTDNAPNVEINVTPSVVEINVTRGSSTAIWGSIEGNLTDQSDLVTALGLKADLVDGKVPSTQLPSYVDDVIEVANYAALPTSGEVGKIYVTLDNNKIYRWSGSLYIEIAANQAIWGGITGNLGDQIDLQNALNTKEPTITAGTTSQYWRGDKSWQTLDKNAVGLGNVDNTSDLNKPISTATQTALDLKFNNPTGDTTQYIAGDGSLITFPISGQAGTIVREVRNTTGATLTKGTIVYISGATGNKATVSKAIATGDSTSAQTFGLLQADISNNANGYVVVLGDLIGLDTSAITEGTQLYLSSTVAGAYTTTKQVAPAHLVYIGVVTRSHPTAGQIEVKIQNGYELDEIHDVSITSKANNQFLVYESASTLWKNKSLSTILGGTSSQFLKGDGSLDSTAYVPTARTLTINGTSYDLSANRSWTITAGVWGQITGILSNQTDLQTALDAKTPTARTLTINGTAYDLSANRSWTIPTHDAVTIGTANGLSLSTQVLSLGLSSASANGALSSTDWTTFNNKQGALTFTSPLVNTSGTVSIPAATGSVNGYLTSADWTTFNNKQGALNGTGFVKISGTTISYDNSTYALDSVVVKLSGSQTIADTKTFSGTPNFDNNIYLKKTGSWANPANYSVIGGMTNGFFLSSGTNKHAYLDLYQLTQARQYDFPNKSGTFAMTSDVPTISGDANYIPKFTGASTLGNSAITDDGSVILATNRIIQTTGTGNYLRAGNYTWVGGSGGDYGSVGYNIGYTSTTNTYNYVFSDNSSMLQFRTGGFRFLTAPLGAAGSAITFTPSMTLGSNGNLLLNATTDAGYKLDVNGTTRVQTSLTSPAIGANAAPNSTYPVVIGCTSGASGLKIIGRSDNLGYIEFFNSNGTTVNSSINGSTSGLQVTGATTFSSTVTATQGIFKNSGVPAIQAFRDLDVTSVGPAGQGIEFGARSGSTYIAGAAIYGGLGNPGTTGNLVFQTLNGGSLGTRLTIESAGAATFSSSVTATVVTAPNINVSANNGMYNAGTNSLGFQTNGSARMFINASGNIGIGATNPTGRLTIQRASSGAETDIDFLNEVGAGPKAKIRFGGTNEELSFWTGGTSILERMRIFQGGNVFIGASPTDAGFKLDVNGTGRVIGSLIGNQEIYSFKNRVSDGYVSLTTASSGAMIPQLEQKTESSVIGSYFFLNRASNISAISGFSLTAWRFTTDFNVTSGNLFEVMSNYNQRFTVNHAGAGTFASTVTATGFFNSSDIRLKDVTDYDYNVSEIKPMNYYWKDKRDDKKHVGYSAQEVQKVMPDAVNEDENGMLSVNYIEVLVAKIAQMEKEIELLKSK